jgi:hypothetical protein
MRIPAIISCAFSRDDGHEFHQWRHGGGPSHGATGLALVHDSGDAVPA